MPTFFIIVQTLCVITSFLFIVIVAVDKDAVQHKALLMCGVSTFISCTGFLLSNLSFDYDAAIMALKFQYLGECFCTLLLALSIIQICNVKIPKSILYGFFIFFTIISALVITCEKNTLIYKSIIYTGDVIQTKPGILYVLFIIANILITVSGIVSIIFSVFKKGLPGKFTAPLASILLLPTIAKIIFLMPSFNNTYELTSVAFSVSCICEYLLLKNYNHFAVFSTAKDNFINAMKEALIVVDSNMQLVETNPAALKLFPNLGAETSKKERNQTINEIFNDEDKDNFVIKDKFYEKHINSIYNKNNDIIGYSALLVDVTKTKNYVQGLIEMKQKADLANSAKTDFLANMSHEIRTPMNAISGFAELCLEEKNYTYANDIKSAAKSLISIINDILDISKIESRKLELVNAPYDTMSLLNDVISIIFIQVNKKPGVEFKLDIDDNLPCRMIGDEVRLKQILINLLNNALKFTNEGHISLSMRGFDNNGISTNIRVKVSDTGIGIKKENFGKLFKNFEQVDTKKNREVEGTGLGLSISKSLIQMMNGNITVESEYGKGTTFTIVISQKIDDNKKISQYSIDTLADSTRGPQKSVIYAPKAKILVVDDNKVNLDVAVHLLNHYKINPDVATSGREAIMLINQNYYDLVFMDHMMPEMDGIEATAIVRSQGDGYSKELPIIALTANAIIGAKEMFIEKGLNDFLSKPIEIPELERILTEWLPKQLVSKNKVPDTKKTAASQISTVNIPGIDFSAGLAYYAGNKDAYVSVMKTFANSGNTAVTNIQQYFADRDYKNYTIEVHGLKSASLSIGAVSLSQLAKDLEQCGKDNDYKTIAERTPVLIAKYQELLNNIKQYLNSLNTQSFSEKSLIPNELLKDKLNYVIKALDEMEAKVAMSILEDIFSYSFNNAEIEKLLLQCKNEIDCYQYENAESIIKRLQLSL